MRTKIEKLAGIFLLIFGLITVFMTSSIILDLFGMREREGNYVLFVIWANFACGILYIVAGVCFLLNKSFVTFPLAVASIILLITMAEMFYHIKQGLPYENKTIGALTFRIVITISYLLWSMKIFKLRKSKFD
ncbi:MAG: hypothetical protein JSR00_03490 [Bacteroidetes bacterium]|nr:hypothetical protein [Bacteroidota bacterium]